jgi:DNA-binding XRE family transcriptional regulator
MNVLTVNSTEKAIQLPYAMLANLPRQKRAALRVYFRALIDLFQNDTFDPENSEELIEIGEAINELFSDETPRLVKGLISSQDPEIRKAEEWFKGLGQAIRRLRRQKRWTQKELAQRSGLSQTAISRFENGTLAPGSRGIERIAKALGVHPGEIDPSLG